MTLIELNGKFVYKSDKEQYGVNEYWSELEEVDGLLVGDCESYSITVKRNINGFSDWDYYYCKLNGNGHCVLSNGKQIIDNNCKRVIPIDEYMKMFKVEGFRKYNKLEVFIKFYHAFLLKLWFKIRR